MSKRKKDAKIFSVRIFDVFPKDDPIAIDILRLMFGCNDTYLIEEWANGRNELFSRRLCRVLSDYGSRRLNPLSTNVADLEKQWLEEERRASRFFPLGMTPSNAFTRN